MELSKRLPVELPNVGDLLNMPAAKFKYFLASRYTFEAAALTELDAAVIA